MPLRTRERLVKICEWPTDTVQIDHVALERPHTLILFVPGNPGCVGWYHRMLSSIVKRLGVSYAARGVSYAGHGVGEERVGKDTDLDDTDRDNRIAWTIDGQVRHKIEWIDKIMADFGAVPRLVFITHSIGAHLVQRICLLRKDILNRTFLILHLMPFIRFDPPSVSKKVLLSTIARSPSVAIAFLRTLSKAASWTPNTLIDVLMKYLAKVNDDDGRDLAIKLFRQPRFGRNFLELGLEEIRTIPGKHDDAALQIIGKRCPTNLLFCGGPDQWAPHFHLVELKALQNNGTVPANIRTKYCPELVHDFVVHPGMVGTVVDFCVSSIAAEEQSCIRPRL